MAYLLLFGFGAAVVATGFAAAAGLSWWLVAAAYPLGGSAGVLASAGAVLAIRGRRPREARAEAPEGALRGY